MANEEHLARLRLGPGAWNRWRQAHPKLRPDLSGAYLRGADLRWVNLTQANLSGAILTKANLRQVDLSGANLTEADLSMAELSQANLSFAIVNQANLRDSHIWETRFDGVALIHANLQGARISVPD